MKLNRYQFEILTFLEKNGAQDYTIRTLSDTLFISGSEIERSLGIMSDNGVVKIENQNHRFNRWFTPPL